MPEILLTLFVLVIILLPQWIAGFMAHSMVRNFWFWFGISFVLPFISIIILVFLKDKAQGKKHKLADHVKD
ncbi:MAG TPA: hypothetical protein DIT07_05140 [Sphingobacteriaceae bacterium]|nr:hypothetical protein [Sphingobacteriaceae bacterium]